MIATYLDDDDATGYLMDSLSGSDLDWLEEEFREYYGCSWVAFAADPSGTEGGRRFWKAQRRWVLGSFADNPDFFYEDYDD